MGFDGCGGRDADGAGIATRACGTAGSTPGAGGCADRAGDCAWGGTVLEPEARSCAGLADSPRWTSPERCPDLSIDTGEGATA
jgi:hypothetical protein